MTDAERLALALQNRSVPMASPSGQFIPTPPLPMQPQVSPYNPIGIGELALSMGTGALAQPIASLYGVGSQLFGGDGKQAANKLAEALTYQPTTSYGQATAQAFGDFADKSGLSSLPPVISGIPAPRLGVGSMNYAGQQYGMPILEKGMSMYEQGNLTPGFNPATGITGKGFSDEGNFRRVGANQPIGSEIRNAGDNPSGISGVIEGVGTGARGLDPAEIAKANAEVKRLIANPDLNPAVQVAKQFNPNFDLAAVSSMPPSSIQKQFPIAKAYDLLTAEQGIDPQLKRLMFAEYLKKYPEVVKKSDATSLSELTQAAYEQLRKENNQQFDALLNQGMNFSYHPGNVNYTGSPEMLRDALLNKHLYTFRGGDRHEFLNQVDPYLGLNDNEKFRAVHDVLGHGTTGSSFGRMGEELAYGAHGQTYSPLAKMAAATETRGQNSFVNYSGLNTDLQRQMDVIRSKRELAQRSGQDTSLFDQQLQELGNKWEYAQQSSLLLPAEMIDPMYKGGIPEYMKPYLTTQNPQSSPGYHWSNKPDLTQTNPGLYGTGIKGAEAERLSMPGAPKERTYFYTNPSLREQGLGSNQYEANLGNLYDPTKDPEKFVSMASLYNKSMGIVDEASKANDWERMIKDAGYSGYVNPYSKSAIMFEPQDVSKVKK